MPIEFDIDEHSRVVSIHSFDVIGIEDIEQVIVDIRQHPDSTDGMSVVIDLRETRRAFFVREMDALIAIMATQAARFVDRYAFVVSTELAIGLSRRFHFRAVRAGLNISVFPDYSSALSWIKKFDE